MIFSRAVIRDRSVTVEVQMIYNRPTNESITMSSRTVEWSPRVERLAACPEHVHVRLPSGPTNVILQRLEAEADERWNCVGKKANQPWSWSAMDAKTRQVMTFHGRNCRRESAVRLWVKVPKVYRQQAVCHTDLYEMYKGYPPEFSVGAR